MNYLANFLSIISLIFGFVSIILSLENHFTFSAWAIIISVVFDGLDGQVARMNPVPSDFGKELDSLVDVISFGVAPAVLGYAFLYQGFHFWPITALFIYLLCSVLRLAKYNLTPKDSVPYYFNGLPTTASGGVLASFILVFRVYAQKFPVPRQAFIILVFGLAYLMISKARYMNLDGLKKLAAGNKLVFAGYIVVPLLVLWAAYFATSVFLPEIAILTLFAIYLISPLFSRKFV